MNVEIRAIGYLEDAGMANNQGHAWSRANVLANILWSRVLTVGVDRINVAMIVGYGLDSTS